MKEVIISLELDTISWILLVLCGLFVGMAKTGFSAVGMIVVPILAIIFGGKPSTGLLLPMLITGDIFAVSYYNRHANWKHVFKLLPWAVTGVLIAVYTGSYISDRGFKNIMAIIIIGSLFIMIWRDYKKNFKVPDFWWFPVLFGILGGFSSMIGNVAGSILALYLLSMNLPKNDYIATGAWFFFIINIFKTPFHIFVWDTVTPQSLTINLLMVPAIILGACAGIKIVKLMNEKIYRWMVIISVFISSLLLFK